LALAAGWHGQPTRAQATRPAEQNSKPQQVPQTIYGPQPAAQRAPAGRTQASTENAAAINPASKNPAAQRPAQANVGGSPARIVGPNGPAAPQTAAPQTAAPRPPFTLTPEQQQRLDQILTF